MQTKEMNQIWDAARELLRNDFAETTFELWFGDLNLVMLDERRAVFTIASDYKCNIIKTKFMEILKDHLTSVMGFDTEIFIVNSDKKQASEDEVKELLYEAMRDGEIPVTEEQPEAIKIYSPDLPVFGKALSATYTFENFIVGNSNKYAHAAAVAVAKNPASGYNPLFIYGQSGLGKTHLMYAIANEIMEKNPQAKIVYIKGEEFTNQLIEAISRKTMPAFREKYRGADVLLIDDVQFIAGRTSTQEEFFHTFNSLYENNKQIILTSDRPPKEMKTLEERLRTRFEWGLTADIQPPDLDLRCAIIKKKAEEMSLDISTEIVGYIADKLRDNIRKLEGSIKKLAAMSFLSGKEITMDMAREATADLMTGTEPVNLVINKIFSTVCDTYNMSVETVKGKKRTADIAKARHVCMYLINTGTELSLTEIGNLFSCDHTTVMSAVRKIKRELGDSGSDLGAEISEIQSKLK